MGVSRRRNRASSLGERQLPAPHQIFRSGKRIFYCIDCYEDLGSTEGTLRLDTYIRNASVHLTGPNPRWAFVVW